MHSTRSCSPLPSHCALRLNLFFFFRLYHSLLHTPRSYHYLSLHRHAKKRLRSANGKFLSKAEIAKLTPEEIARLEQLMVEKEKEKMAAAAAMTNTPEPNPPKRRRTAAAPGRGHAVDSDEE